MLPDATDPDAITEKGPERVWPDDGVIKETVGAAIETFIDLDTTSLCLPVESITFMVNVWLPLVQEVASRFQPNPKDPSWL